MTIETRYNLEDEVWVVKDNKPVKGKVRHMYIQVGSVGKQLLTETLYYVLYTRPYHEHEMFTTEEEALKFIEFKKYLKVD